MASTAIEELYEAAANAMGKGLLTCRISKTGLRHVDGRGEHWHPDECPSCRLELALNIAYEDMAGGERDDAYWDKVDHEIDVAKEEAR